MSAVAAILGSAFSDSLPDELDLKPEQIETDWGSQTLYRVLDTERPAYVLFRHEVPHRLLPNQINYRAQAAALHAVDCKALLVTSSVGVLDADVPLYRPLLVEDLLMPENRLPDGSACTMFTEPSDDHGHLVINDSLFATDLTEQVRDWAAQVRASVANDVVFAYVQGPRSKTAAENRMLPPLGAQVNSMTLGPEVVLANELEIPCAGLVVGHKYSIPDRAPPEQDALSTTLDRSREEQERIVTAFLQEGEPVEFPNTIYRFGDDE
ncbi:5'-methylthioadenosine phosphorylase [Salinibacter sp. 10B]|uniref:phosphorylase family protein n=1 Tax=Salinibacter sp. 10B TaxID=1923971 RepID=UPI000CF476F8|nr:5'-methylthioadenosine phosphorylase [Salinibacter sp. 10B]PQJ35698.1 5'-methylthioadenosine phosphorylase [Salinibacter sp. 10B]